MNDNKKDNLAVLSYLSFLFVIPMFTKSSFCRFHAKQGMVLFICSLFIFGTDYLSANILIDILPEMVVVGINLIVALLTLMYYTLIVFGIINVVKGFEKKLPIIGGLIK